MDHHNSLLLYSPSLIRTLFIHIHASTRTFPILITFYTKGQFSWNSVRTLCH